MKNAKKYGVLAPLSAAFCATVLTIAGGLSANVSYASTTVANVVGSSSTGSNDANSQIKFKDENLKKALLKTMKNQRLIADNASEITYGDAKKLYHADITYGNITNLSGIENFTGLNRIDFDHNNISDLSPLSNITSLESIYASYNKISNLTPLKSLSSLECLRADNNKITDFSTIENLTNLNTLYLGDNSGITNFDTLKKFTNLTDLNLDDTQFSDLNIIKDLKNLKLLYLQAAKVSDLSPISNLTNLTSLRLYGNQITSIAPLRNLTKLTDLGLEYNKGITDFTPISGLTNLNSLSLTGNNLKSIDSLKTLQKLTYVDISYNDIKDFSVLEKLKSLSSASIGSQTVSLNSDEPSTSLDIDFAKNLTFTAEDTSYGSVKNGSFVLSDNSLPYEGNVTINFNNGKSFKIGSANIDSGKYNGTITLHLNVPKIETVKGKMKYDSSSDLKYGEKKVITQAKNGTKKIYANQPEEIVTNAVDGKTEVGNKEVKTEEIQPGITYQADSSLAYKQEQPTEGAKGTKTTTTIYKVDENAGLTNTVQSSESRTTTPAKDKVIKVGNVETETEVIKFKTTYIADDTLPYNTQKDKTAGKNGSKTVTTTYKVDKTTGLSADVESTQEKKVDPTDHVVRVGNKQVTHEGNKTITTTYDVDPNTGKLTNPKKHTSMPAGKLTPSVQHDNSEPAVLDTQEAEILPSKMKYEADETIPYNTQKKIKDPVDGLKVTTHTGSFVNGAWVPSDKVETTAAQDGLTKVGNKQVTHEGNKTIATTYDVDPDTGKLTNPKTHTSMPMATLIDPSANPGSNDNDGDHGNGGSGNTSDGNGDDNNSGSDNNGGNNNDNNGGGSVAPDLDNNSELNIGGGNGGDVNNTNGSANGTSNGASVNANSSANGSASGVANRMGSSKSRTAGTRSADALPNTGSSVSGTTFASFGALVLGLSAAGVATNRKRAKHLR